MSSRNNYETAHLDMRVTNDPSDVLRLCIQKPPSAGKALDAANTLEKSVWRWSQGQERVTIVSHKTDSDLRLFIIGDNQIGFTLFHPDFPSSVSFKAYHTVAVSYSEKLNEVLGSAAYFIRCLRLGTDTGGPQCTVEVHRVEKEYDWETLLYQYTRAGEPNLRQADGVKVIADGETCYGVTVTSPTEETVYVAGIAYFDCSDFSIGMSPSTCLFQHLMTDYLVELRDNTARWIPESGTLDMLISHDSPPIVFKLRPKQARDFGFIKIFFAEDEVDISCITQGEAFRDTRELRDAKPTSPLGSVTIFVDQSNPEVRS